MENFFEIYRCLDMNILTTLVDKAKMPFRISSMRRTQELNHFRILIETTGEDKDLLTIWQQNDG